MLNLFAAATSYDYSYTTTTTSSSGGAALGATFVILMLIALVFAVVAIIAMWRIFEKAGEKGWKSLIPIYNSWILFEISGKPGWWALISLIPYVGSFVYLVLYILAALQLAKNFGKSQNFAIFGLIIFSVVGMLILAFGDAKYTGTKYVANSTTPPAAA
jgi:hypothetical protein